MFDHSFQSLWPPLQDYEVILPLGACKALKNGKNVLKIVDISTFWTLVGPLVAIWVQILVEEVISFEVNGQTSKSDKY